MMVKGLGGKWVVECTHRHKAGLSCEADVEEWLGLVYDMHVPEQERRAYVHLVAHFA